MDNTNFNFRCLCIMDSVYLLDGVLGILRDLNTTTFGIFDANELPLNISGDLKDINYNYTGLMATKQSPNLAFIKEVETVKMPYSMNSEFGQDTFIGEANFHVELSRYPRQ
mgnify:CR=1 FL=1